MSLFQRLHSRFDVNWATVAAGWDGYGAYSPWPEKQNEFPSFMSAKEVEEFAVLQLQTTGDNAEHELIYGLRDSLSRGAERDEVRNILNNLCVSQHHSISFEFRKWRLIIVEDLISNLPLDPMYALLALTEFWQSVGFPEDCPHVIQGRHNDIPPQDYYQNATLQKAIADHEAWIKTESAQLSKSCRRKC